MSWRMMGWIAGCLVEMPQDTEDGFVVEDKLETSTAVLVNGKLAKCELERVHVLFPMCKLAGPT